MPGGAEWGMVAVTTELHRLARELRVTAGELYTESRRWSYPRGRQRWEDAAALCESMSQRCAMDAVSGDYWSRLDAVQRATAEAASARLTLRTAVRAGELWNDHRMQPIPARLFDAEGRLAGA